MIPKHIDQIAEQDLQTLVDNSVSERKTIEYKQSLYGNSDSDKKDFLAEVSSFANASGGDLIFGIVQDNATGLPVRLEGLDIQNVDQEILRLESMIRDGVEPRIPSVVTRPIKLSNLRTAIVIRVPRSWISPHRVSYKGHDKFYSRSSNGKYPLDVSELRVAFNLSEAIQDRIREFREDRISRVVASQTPVQFYDNAKIVLHLIPLSAFSLSQNYDISKVAVQPDKMVPLYCSGWNHRYNLDGFLAYSAGREGKSHSYVQLFRNGIIEAVEGLLLRPQNERLVIPSIAYEQELIQSLPELLSNLKTLGVDPPILVFLTLVGVKGYEMAYETRWLSTETNKIDRDILLLPEVIAESYDVVAKDILRPCFDSIWNACGFARSFNYNEQGDWAPRR